MFLSFWLMGAALFYVLTFWFMKTDVGQEMLKNHGGLDAAFAYADDELRAMVITLFLAVTVGPVFLLMLAVSFLFGVVEMAFKLLRGQVPHEEAEIT